MNRITSFDPAPLLAFVDRLVVHRRRVMPRTNVEPECSSDNEVAELLGVSRRQVVRWRSGQARIPWYEADRFAVDLGLHLENIWPEAAAWCPHPVGQGRPVCGCAA